MIIQLHTLATEVSISQQMAIQKQPCPDDAQPDIIDDKALANNLATMQYAESIHTFYHANITAKHPHGIADERLQLIKLSLKT